MDWTSIIQTILEILVIGGVIWVFSNKVFKPYKDMLRDTKEHYKDLIEVLKEKQSSLKEKHEAQIRELESQLMEQMEAVKAGDLEKRETIRKVQEQLDRYKRAYENEKKSGVELQLRHSNLISTVREYDRQHGTTLSVTPELMWDYLAMLGLVPRRRSYADSVTNDRGSE